MAIATANIYRANVVLASGLAAGVQPIGVPGPGQEVLIIAQTQAAAISIVNQYFTSPAPVSISCPVLVGSGALTTGTGTLFAEEETPPPPEEEPPAHGHSGGHSSSSSSAKKKAA